MTKVFVSDIDGTLVGSGGSIHPRDAAAVAEMLRRGVPVALCTGRMFSGTRDVGMRLRMQGPAACIDGSHIVDLHSRGELSCTAIAAETSRHLIEALSMYRPASFVFSGDRVIHDRLGKRFLGYVSTWSEVTHEVADVIHPEVWRKEPSVAALVALGTEDQIRGTERALAGAPALQVACFEVRREHFKDTWGMVIRAAGVDKGTAVEWLAQHYGVGTEDIIAVGDWLNDVPMFERAGTSYAMAQAPEEVKRKATYVLEADIFKGGGVAEAAERAGLI